MSHNCCSVEEILSKLDPSPGDLSFKFEAFVLHVQCRSLDDAQIMVSFSFLIYESFRLHNFFFHIYVVKLWSSSWI